MGSGTRIFGPCGGALVAQIARDGVLVPGSAGAPVAHPGLRFLAQLDAALSAHERATDAGDADPLAAMRQPPALP